MSKKRKQSYMLLALAAGLGLVLDRLVVTGVATLPATARATNAQPVIAKSSVPSMPELPFPKQLQPYAPGDPVRDIFAMPDDPGRTKPLENDQRAIGPDHDKGNGDLSASQFRAKHHLEGLLDTEGLRLAILDGRWLRVGQKINGCMLEKVIGTSAYFRCLDGLVELKIGPQGLQGNDPHSLEAQ